MKRLLPLFFLVPLLVSCNRGPMQITLQGPEGKTAVFTVELADRDEERIQGLMHRTTLDTGHGMLFVFPAEQALSFWMYDTLIPLDIAFFDGSGNFINAFTMDPCSTDPCPKYNSASFAKYALELGKGERANNDIGPGWKIAPEDLAKLPTAQ